MPRGVVQATADPAVLDRRARQAKQKAGRWEALRCVYCGGESARRACAACQREQTARQAWNRAFRKDFT